MAAYSVWPNEPLEGPIRLDLVFVMPRPTKRDGRKHKHAFRYPHAIKPDLDNLIKSVVDALTGLLWRDDKQIFSVTASKHVASAVEQPHVIVKAEEAMKQ